MHTTTSRGKANSLGWNALPRDRRLWTDWAGMGRLDFVNRRAQPNAGELGGQRLSVAEWQFPFFGAMGQGSKAADKSRIELPGHLLPRACQSANHNGRIFSYFSQQPAPCALRFGVHFFPPLRAVSPILTPASLFGKMTVSIVVQPSHGNL